MLLKLPRVVQLEDELGEAKKTIKAEKAQVRAGFVCGHGKYCTNATGGSNGRTGAQTGNGRVHRTGEHGETGNGVEGLWVEGGRESQNLHKNRIFC